MSDGRNMKIDKFKQVDLRLILKIIGYKVNYNTRLNYVLTRFIHATYMMTVEKENINMCDILR